MKHSYVDARPSHTPRVDRALRLANGRCLQVAEWGPSDGTPIVFFHGRPGARLLCPDVTATEQAGVRYVSFDRPGYGRSDPAPPPVRRADVVSDVGEVLDQLGIERAAMVGWSGGGPYALACGALAPERVTSIATVCSPGRRDTEDDVSDEVWKIVQIVASDPIVHRDLVRSRCQWLADDPHRLLGLTEQYSPATLSAPGMREAFAAWMQEAAAVSIEGYVDDWLMDICDDGLGFELRDVKAPVFCWFGAQDRIVPPLHAHLQAAQLPNCQSFGCPECGHFVLIAHWPQILDQITRPAALN